MLFFFSCGAPGKVDVPLNRLSFTSFQYFCMWLKKIEKASVELALSLSKGFKLEKQKHAVTDCIEYIKDEESAKKYWYLINCHFFLLSLNFVC